jgi:hypothetical protein
MPASAAAGAPANGGGGGGGNPFQLATNLYCEKNNSAVLSGSSVTTSQQSNGGQVNAGQYLRGIRLVVRAQSASSSVSTFAATISDWPWNVLTQVDLVNVDGSEILYVMGGYAHYLAQKYGRPWLGDPAAYSDAAASTNLAPQFTLFLQPEIRWTAGVLANTDTRSQYRFDYTIDSLANIVAANGGSYNAASAPVISVTPYLDAWAQPDAEDLQGTPNQPVPPGLNLQYKRRHQIFTMNAGGSDNIFQSALTGNALRNQILVTRNGGSARAEGLTDPILWQIDNRSLGKISTNAGSGIGTTSTSGQTGGDMVQNWMSEFYSEYFPTTEGVPVGAAAAGAAASVTAVRREAGVYVFPRFIKPGSMYGQGWLYTANSTKEIFESSSVAGYSAGTMELISDEVYPVGPVDPSLTDI